MTRLASLKLFLNLLFRQANLTTAVKCSTTCFLLSISFLAWACLAVHLHTSRHRPHSKLVCHRRNHLYQKVRFAFPPSVLDRRDGSLAPAPAFPPPGRAGVSQCNQSGEVIGGKRGKYPSRRKERQALPAHCVHPLTGCAPMHRDKT